MNRFIEKAKMWGSHIPLLHAVMRSMRIRRIVECGMGPSSTPLFLSYEPSLLRSYEHDERWFNKVVSGVSKCPAFIPELVRLRSGISGNTRRQSATQEEVAELDEVYARIASELGGTESIDLLFVDTIAAARLSALRQLQRLSRIVVIHDTEPEHFHGYCYDRFVSECGNQYWRYSYRLSHGIPWSDVFTRERLPLKNFLNELRSQSERFFEKSVMATFELPV